MLRSHTRSPAPGAMMQRQHPFASASSGLGPSGPSTLPAVWAAAVHIRGVTGVAVFDAETTSIWVAEAPDEPAAGFAFLRLALERAAPRTVYASSKASDEFLAAIGDGLAAALAEDDSADAAAPGTPSGGGSGGGAARGPAGSSDVRIEKATLFALDAARRRLLAVRVGAMGGGAPGMHALHARVRLDAEAQVRAVGALIAILQRDGLLLSAAPGGGDAAPAHLASICERSLEGYLTVDPESQHALGVFAPEAHPSQFIGSAKEGLSVYGLLDTCVTQPGKRLLKSWLRRPLVDVAALNARLDAVEFFTRADDAAGALNEPLRRLRDTPRLLEHLAAAGGATPKKEFQTLCDSVAATLQLAEALQACAASGSGAAPAAAALFARLAAAVDDASLRSVYELVAHVVDFEADAESPWLVAHGVSEELDDMKHTYDGLPDFLTHMARFEMARIPPELCFGGGGQAQGEASAGALQTGGVVLSLEYIPKIGHCVRLQGRGTRPLSAELAAALPDYVFAFEGETDAGYGAYYFGDRTRGLDAELGDLFHRISDLEGALLVDLKRRILEHSGALRRGAAAAAETDALLALARGARALNLRRPTLGGDAALHVAGGRHMLAEQLVDVFVPNDAEAGADAGRVTVITGPNFSGKSIYLKQVALIVFLAHVGSFVPADAATVPICDRIFARLAGAESVAAAVAQSAFMADAHRVAHALAHSTKRSLLVVDEFGKGTLASDGAALLCATLDTLAQRGPQAPIALFATHFSEVHDAELLPRSPALRFATMSVHATVQAAAGPGSRPDDDVVFLYKLVPGHAAPSYGLHCARLAGVPLPVVARAAEVLRCVEAGTPLAPAHADARLAARNAHCRAVVSALLELDVDNASAEELDAFLAGVRAAAADMDEDLARLTQEAADAAAAAAAAEEEHNDAA